MHAIKARAHEDQQHWVNLFRDPNVFQEKNAEIVGQDQQGVSREIANL